MWADLDGFVLGKLVIEYWKLRISRYLESALVRKTSHTHTAYMFCVCVLSVKIIVP